MNTAETPSRPRWTRWPRGRTIALVCGIWLTFSFVEAILIYLLRPLAGQPLTWSSLIRHTLPEAPVWALLTPLVLALVRWKPVVAPWIGRRVAFHFLAALAVHMLAAIGRILLPSVNSQASIPARLIFSAASDLTLYAIIAAIGQAILLQEAAQERRTEALRLRSQLAESRLHTLTLQLQPHFLFNALHGISELIYRDPRAADQAISRLADLLRMAIASSGQTQGTLEEEVRFLEAYADIERLRMGDLFHLELDVPAETRPLAIPVLLIQPLVENAFRHGIRSGGGRQIHLAVRKTGRELTIRVSDDGPGFATLPPHEGLGLSNTRVRLESLYGSEQRLRYRQRAGGGAEVEIAIPARELAWTNPASAPLAEGA